MSAVVDIRPLVVIGVPSGDRVHTEFAQCLWGIGRGAKHHRQGIAFGQSSMIVNARNQCVEAALTLKADYIMFIDSDMTFPYTAIDTLLAHKKDIVGATYVRRGLPFDNLGHALYERDRAVKTGLVEMSHIPTGMLLIKMSVFDKFKKPYFRFTINEELELTNGEDFVFSTMARDAGLRLWCDIDLSKDVGHMYQYALRPEDPALRKVAEDYAAKVANG